MHLSNPLVAILLIVRTVVAHYNVSVSICDALAAKIPTDIFYPDSSTYNASIASYPFPQLRLHPACVVRPKSAQDVSTAIKIIGRDKDAKFAVKGGGHNANAGFNNVEDGITIDMQSLKAVTIGPAGVVSAGAGALTQDLYDVTDKHNVSVLAGRIGVVGIGGFLTGGGVSFFSPAQGWACDAVLNFEVVLASGVIVNANATSNTDLFAALKGGQLNFGVVTRFDLGSFPAGPVWGGRIVYGNGTEDALLAGFTKFKDPNNFDPHGAGWLTFDYASASKQFTTASIMWYTKPESQPGTLGYITNVVPKVMDGTLVASVGAFARNASMAVKNSPKRTIWATTTFRISPTIISRLHSIWKTLAPKICETYAYAGAESQLTFQAIMPAPAPGSPQNSMGISESEAPEKNLIFLQIVFIFTDASANPGLQNALKDFIKLFEDATEAEGVKHRYKYLNFAAAFQDPFEGYGEHQVRKLKGVARKYDPSGMFQRQVGGFKLFETDNSSHGRGW